LTVLSDEELEQLIRDKKIVVHPILARRQIQCAKIDLRLGNVIYLIKYFEQSCYDPKDRLNIEYGEEKKIGFDQPFILQPGDFALAPLFERVKIPENIIGRLDGRSSFGRLGIIVHATAGGIDPGFSGKIICELSNLGKVPVKLYPLTRIAALILEKLDTPAKKAYGSKTEKKYKSVLATMLSEDYEYTEDLFEEVTRKL
jgi:dCTP deaminase